MSNKGHFCLYDPKHDSNFSLVFHLLNHKLFDRTHIKMAANKKAFDMQIKLLMIGDSGR